MSNNRNNVSRLRIRIPPNTTTTTMNTIQNSGSVLSNILPDDYGKTNENTISYKEAIESLLKIIQTLQMYLKQGKLVRNLSFDNFLRENSGTIRVIYAEIVNITNNQVDLYEIQDSLLQNIEVIYDKYEDDSDTRIFKVLRSYKVDPENIPDDKKQVMNTFYQNVYDRLSEVLAQLSGGGRKRKSHKNKTRKHKSHKNKTRKHKSYKH
jgi:hypothetical protein